MSSRLSRDEITSHTHNSPLDRMNLENRSPEAAGYVPVASSRKTFPKDLDSKTF